MSVKTYTDNQLLSRLETLTTFKGFPVGMFDIWIRSNENKQNQFDDKVYTYEGFGNAKEPVFKFVTTGTTNTGDYGLLNFGRWNKKGCAVLLSNQIVYNSHVFGYHKRNPKHPAYIQAKSIPYTRDSNKNLTAENYGEIYTDIIGANCHSVNRYSVAWLINNFSVGCLVRNIWQKHIEWLNIMNKGPLSVAILDEF